MRAVRQENSGILSGGFRRLLKATLSGVVMIVHLVSHCYTPLPYFPLSIRYVSVCIRSSLGKVLASLDTVFRSSGEESLVKNYKFSSS